MSVTERNEVREEFKPSGDPLLDRCMYLYDKIRMMLEDDEGATVDLIRPSDLVAVNETRERLKSAGRVATADDINMLEAVLVRMARRKSWPTENRAALQRTLDKMNANIDVGEKEE